MEPASDPLKSLKSCTTCKHFPRETNKEPCKPCIVSPDLVRWEPRVPAICVPVGCPTARVAQVGGDHYSKQPIQPWEYSMANKLDPVQHTAIKYITRFRDKGGKQDLEKAIHSIQWLIEWEYGERSEQRDGKKRN